jgi:beta-lactam-binding protein with PASTA domain
MRFLLGVLLGYSMRGKKRALITVLTALAFIVYVVIPAIALLALRLDVQRERRMRPMQIQVPALKGLSYEDAETKLRASNLNIRLLATRCDLPLQPGIVIDQSPQPGEKIDLGYPIAVTVTKAAPNWRSSEGPRPNH